MPVPSTVADLSSTASSNYPSGSESIGTSLDDYLRAHASIIKQVSDAKADTSHTQAASTISDSTAAGRSLLTAVDAAAQRTTLGLGTAATANTGTSAGNVVVLDGSAKLPAVDGSQLTGISSLPTQTGNSGKFLTTNGTSASWGTVSTGVTWFESAEISIPAADSTVNTAHSLGAVPKAFFVVLRCKTAEFGYSVGDEVPFSAMDGDGSRIQGVWANSTYVNIRTGTTPFIKRVDTSGGVAITAANWRFVIRAHL